MRVLVLGDDTRSFLASVRSLGRAGLTVEVSMSRPGTAAASSRFIAANHRLPPLHLPEQWFTALQTLMAERDFAFVLPCYDTHAAILQDRKSELLHAERYALLAEEAYRTSSSKAETHKLAARLGIPVPEEIRVYRDSEVEAAIHQLGFPVVVKPVESVFHDTPARRNSVKKATNEVDAFQAFHQLNHGDGVLFQRNFVGRGLGVEFLARNGLTLALFQHERLHEPALGGQSSYRRSVPLRLPMAEGAIEIARALHWTGPGMVEYKLNPETGEWVLIEVNGRLWGSLPLTIAAGLDVPRLLYEIWTGQPANPPQTYRHGIYCRNWHLDAAWLRQNFMADPEDATLLRVSGMELLGEARHVLTGMERSDAFAIDDPKPAFAEVRRLARSVFRPHWLYSITGRERQEKRALEAAANASSVLFVCQANVCRGPFAELALRKYAGDAVPVSSAGINNEPGRVSPAVARRAAEEFAVDLAEHRSRVVDAGFAAQFDVIFVFDRWHEAALLDLAPELREKVHFLGALDAEGPLEIFDPWGRPEKMFVDVYAAIDRLTARIVMSREGDAHAERQSTTAGA